MRLRIHRAADEIGGNCIELEALGLSLIVDLGLPLAAHRPDISLLPAMPGLSDGRNPNLLGIVLSHPHRDHYGLLASAHASIPVYLGEGAARLLKAASAFTSDSNLPQTVSAYRSNKPFRVGPFEVTPILVDHSAYDAHALLVSAGEKRVLYSGDFRLHGRKSKAMQALFKTPPPDIDVLLMEGTTLTRDDETPESESSLEDRVLDSLQKTKGLALAYCSAQNIDRIVTFYRAAVRSGRTFVIDVYTAHLLGALGRSTLPSAGSKNVRVYLPARLKRQLARSGNLELVDSFRRHRIYLEELSASPSKWLMLFRDSMREDVESLSCKSSSTLMYSLWPGYLRRGMGISADIWSGQQGMRFEVLHTSGHASAADLRTFAKAMRPRRLIPMHTLTPDRFRNLWPEVQIVPNGEWVEV